MWKCKVCDTEVEDDSWEQCWKCSHSRETSEDEVASLRPVQARKESSKPKCLRCGVTTYYAGTKKFHEGSNLGFWLGDFGHLFENAERYDSYVCSNCGKVEFFVDGIGDAMRGEEASGYENL